MPIKKKRTTSSILAERIKVKRDFGHVERFAETGINKRHAPYRRIARRKPFRGLNLHYVTVLLDKFLLDPFTGSLPPQPRGIFLRRLFRIS